MPEYLRSLTVIVFISVCVFSALRKPVTAGLMTAPDFRRRAGMWLALTVTAFVAHSFWLFSVVAGLLLVLVGRSDSNRIALFAFVMLVIPPFRVPIEGFAGINRFIDLDYPRLLTIAVLLPSAFQIASQYAHARLFRMPADKYVLGYLALQLALTAQATTSTDMVRTAVGFTLDVWLPYYVFSRALVDSERMREVFAAVAVSCSVLAAIALFEGIKGWLLYSSLPSTLGLAWSYGNYMYRDTSLRAVASAGHSIYLGFVLTVAMGLHMSLKSTFTNRRAWLAVLCLLGMGIAVTFARGPWIGAATLLLVAFALEPKSKRVYGKAVLGAVVALPVLMATPLGARILTLLPFVGRYDEGSVDYRQELFKVSWDVLMMNPMFGSPFYMASPAMEVMRQGEGIIDVVNTYLGVALSSGLVGLALFLSIFGSSAWRIMRSLRVASDKEGAEHLTGRSLMATLAGIAVTVATVGIESPVSLVTWCVAGAAAAFAFRTMNPGRWVEHTPRQGLYGLDIYR